MNSLAPIAIFAFNRPDHLRQTLTALTGNELAQKSHVVIFCDGPRNERERIETDAVRSVAHGATGFASLKVVERSKNLGCGPAIIAGLTEMFETYESLIVIEDDIILANNGLTWFNLCLEKYRNDPRVLAISAWSYPEQLMTFPSDYQYDAYFLPRFQCWGWASWKDRLVNIDWTLSDGFEFLSCKPKVESFARGGKDLIETFKAQLENKIKTWDIQVAYHGFKNNQYTLVPRIPYSTNIGTYGKGTHIGDNLTAHPTLAIDLRLSLDKPRLPPKTIVDERLLKSFMSTLRNYTPKRSIFSKIKAICRNLFLKFQHH